MRLAVSQASTVFSKFDLLLPSSIEYRKLNYVNTRSLVVVRRHCRNRLSESRSEVVVKPRHRICALRRTPEFAS